MLIFYVPFLENALFYVVLIKDSFSFTLPNEFYYQFVHSVIIW